MRKQCAPGSLSSSPAQEPGNKLAQTICARIKWGLAGRSLVPRTLTKEAVWVAGKSYSDAYNIDTWLFKLQCSSRRDVVCLGAVGEKKVSNNASSHGEG